MNRKRKLWGNPKQQAEKSVELYKILGSAKKVSDASGIPLADVRRYLEKAGLKPKPHEVPAPWVVDACKLWKQGRSLAKIKKELNLPVSRARIHQVVLRELGKHGRKN